MNKQIAEDLLKIEAVKLRMDPPFKWTSGWNSPIYCDNRLSLSFPEVRTRVKRGLVDLVKRHFPQVESLAGVATAGIPQGALIADVLDLPYLYVRSSPKGHGMENLIEGKVLPGQKVVVVEDLVSTGKSSLQAVVALREAGLEVLGMVSVFTYGFPLAEQVFKEANVPFVSLTDYDTLIGEALRLGYIKEDQLQLLGSWKKDPSTWLK
ncbi:MAG: orotate phosphoribosyltransferase [Cytophagales bacterium]|nr:orotate phosphoribosyltransferase [Cytophagales bacterium]